jgi:pyrroline-5-carboxylate reductase
VNRKDIGFIGAGNMAQAIIKGIVNSSLKKSVTISAYDTNPDILKKTCVKYRVKKASSNAALVRDCGILILAVKPQSMAEVLVPLRGQVAKSHLIISIAAGVSIASIQDMLMVKCPVVRVMPNTPALIGEGAAGYSFSKEAGVSDKKSAEKILSTFCRFMAKLPETSINTVTALSGSGPAYVFYFAEAMLDAAKELGFDAETAMRLVAQTFIGSAKLMSGSPEPPAELRLKVTSKGGTTQRAIESMESAGVKDAVKKAVIAAKLRADELGK